MSGLVDVYGNPLVAEKVVNQSFQQFSPFGGFTGNSAPGASTPVSQTDPIFKNLRWYLASNFRQMLSQAFVEIGLVQTLVCVPVDDAFKGGVEFRSKQLDEEQIQELQISIDRDADLINIAWAHKWNRLFGGAGVLVLTDQDPEEPLDVSAINKDTPLEFRDADMWELFWDMQNTDGYDPSVQMQNFKTYSYYGEKVDKSRVMRLKGLRAPSFIRPRLRGWGVSVVEALVVSLNQYLKGINVSYEVLDEFKIDVYKIKNLVNTLLSPQGEAKVHQRIQRANWQKNYQNAIVMDSEDDWDHKQLSFAGLAEVQAGARMQIAADMRMPITKLFGTSVSGGIGNTDQNDMENYNSMVESDVREKAKYDILRMAEIKCQKLFGIIPEDLSVAFKPLRTLTAIDEENVKTQKFNRLHQAAESGRITTLEYREGINKGNLLDITLDNAGEVLNPNDPQVRDIAKEGQVKSPEQIADVDDPGANRADTRKTRAWETGGIPQGKEKPKKPGADNVKVET